MSVQRVGGVEMAFAAMSPEAMLALDLGIREFVRASAGRLTGARKTATYEAVIAVNTAAAEIMSARRASSGDISGDESAVVVAPLRACAAPATDEPDWLSTEDAAQRLGMTEGHTRWLARQGRLRARRAPGGGWRFDPADVDVWGARTA